MSKMVSRLQRSHIDVKELADVVLSPPEPVQFIFVLFVQKNEPGQIPPESISGLDKLLNLFFFQILLYTRALSVQ